MLRLFFTPNDLLRTKFVEAAAPLMELGLAVAKLQDHDHLFDPWRRRMSLRRAGAAAAMLQLVPVTGTGPTFLDPLTEELDDGLELVQASQTPLVHRELRRITTTTRPVTPFLRAVYDRDEQAWNLLDDALRSAYAELIAPSWDRIRAAYRADIAFRMRLLLRAGLHDMLLSLQPGSYWVGEVLHIPAEVSVDVQLQGRGVTLVPSLFRTGRPLLARHTDDSTLVVYASSTPLPVVEEDADGRSLGNLIGRTRAAVLARTLSPRSTTELADDLDISPASVSEHTTVLRGAGLITSTRRGKSMEHLLTPLGERLLLG